MKQPNDQFTVPDFSRTAKIMFITEGNTAAMVVTNRGGRRKATAMEFATAEAALGWCRSHRALLVYSPANLAHN